MAGFGETRMRRRLALLLAAVLAALEASEEPDEFRQMERLSQLSGVPIPGNLQGLQTKPELHTGVIAKEAMADFVKAI